MSSIRFIAVSILFVCSVVADSSDEETETNHNTTAAPTVASMVVPMGPMAPTPTEAETKPEKAVSAKPTFPTGLNPKRAIIERFKVLVSDFLTDKQLSKSIDVTAVGFHRGTPMDQIIDDLYARLKRKLTTQQISDLAKAKKGLQSDLDEKTIKVMKQRVEQIIIHSLEPAVEQIRQYAVRPSIAFALMSETLNPRFIQSIKSLIRSILSEEEYGALQKHLSPKIVKL